MEPNNSQPDALDAMRIQVAAVAAQQAALTEEEFRLLQRRSALEKQETQLAAHLDDRRRRLQEMQDEIKADRTALEQERAVLLAELRQEKENAARERQHFVELRSRQKERWLAHWRQQEAALQGRQAQVDAEREQTRKQVEALQRERAAFEQGRLKLNGELELRRCGLQEELQELALSQQRWEEALNAEHAERQRREKALAAREAAVAETERNLAEHKRQWEQGQETRRLEIDGLEKRVRHLRSQLPQAQVILMPTPAAPTPSVDTAEVPPALQRLADDIADQRWRLLEQWQQLAEVYGAWDKERADIAAALETTALQFIEREQQLVVQESALGARFAAVQRQHEALAEQRQRLDGWQARLTAQEAGWEGERAKLLVEIQVREEGIGVLTQQLALVRQRRERRRRQELDALRAAHARCEEMRRQYATLWHDCQKRQALMTQRERELSSLRMALERYRVESLLRAPNPATADKRIEKLTQNAAERFNAAERELTKQRDILKAEAAQLEGRAEQLQEWQDELDQRSQDLAHQEANEEVRRLGQTATDQQRERTLRQLQLRRQHDERQLTTLREEVERVARLLLDEAPDELSRAA